MSLLRVCASVWLCVWGSPRTPLVFTFVDLICNSSNNFEWLSTRLLYICVPTTTPTPAHTPSPTPAPLYSCGLPPASCLLLATSRDAPSSVSAVKYYAN